MANIINLNAEIGANYIGDDAQPAVAFGNSSTGPGIQVDKLVVTSTATVVSTASAAPAISVSKTVLSTASSSLIQALISTASTPVFQLSGQAFVSAVSLIFAAGANWAGMGAIPVQRSDGTLGWIPVLPPGQVTGAAFS